MTKFSEVFSNLERSKIAVNTIKNIAPIIAVFELTHNHIISGNKEKNNIVDGSEFKNLKKDRSVLKNKNAETK